VVLSAKAGSAGSLPEVQIRSVWWTTQLGEVGAAGRTGKLWETTLPRRGDTTGPLAGTLSRGYRDATALRVEYSRGCEKKGPIDRSVIGVDLKVQGAGDIASNHLMPSHDLQSG
jgi:hypothetical protein